MKRALLASYATQAYVGLIGLVLMPVYMRYMGVEAFGMVGLFLMLQAWLQLLDFGLSPSLSREMSLYRAGILDAAAAWDRLRGLECVLGAIALLAVLGLLVARNWIATDWLRPKHLAVNEVSQCIIAMTLAAAARWLAGIYRAALIGLERQLSINAAMTAFATLKFAGVIPLLIFWSAAPLVFFSYQASIGALELAVFAALMYRVLPGSAATVLPSVSALRGMLPVAGAMAFMSGMWVFLTQIDKLILSRVLSLDVFGYYTVAVAAAGSVLALVPPLNQVLQPRMTILAAQGRHAELNRLYCMATQFSTVAFAAVGGGLALFAEPALWAWTGSRTVASEAAPILFWYGLANGLIGLLALPFMLQFAHGYLRLHVIGNIVLGVTLLPALAFAALHYGAAGAGAVLFFANLAFLLLWVPLAYRRLIRDLVWRWFVQDVMPAASVTLFVLSLVAAIMPVEQERLQAGVLVVGAILLSASAGLLAGRRTREFVVNTVFRKDAA